MKKFLGLDQMTLDCCCRLPKWQAVKRRSLRYGRMGNSRKHPYYTTDGFHILTPRPCPWISKMRHPPNALKVVNLPPVWCLFVIKPFGINSGVCK